MSADIIPDSIHLCPRCYGLASGPSLCEECRSITRLSKHLDRELRFAWAMQPWRGFLAAVALPVRGCGGKTREVAALLFCFFGLCGYVAIIVAAALRLAEALQ